MGAGQRYDGSMNWAPGTDGWVIHGAERLRRTKIPVAQRVLLAANQLGMAQESHKGSGLVQRLQAVPSAESRSRNSLSSRYGLGNFPFHTDDANRRTPSRYVVLGCEVETTGTPTLLLPWGQIADKLTPKTRETLRQQLFVAKRGRQSFLTAVIGPHIIRYDPHCLAGYTADAREALGCVASAIQELEPSALQWHPGDVAVIDNWKVAHGRGPVGSGHRVIWRSLVKAEQ